MILHGERLDGVHIDLVRVIIRAGTRADFQVQQGLRTSAEQRKLVAAGKSQTLNSRHLTGHAVDLTALLKNGAVTWDFEVYRKLSEVVLAVAFELAIPVTWGGNWQSLRDGPHFELPESRYPVEVKA